MDKELNSVNKIVESIKNSKKYNSHYDKYEKYLDCINKYLNNEDCSNAGQLSADIRRITSYFGTFNTTFDSILRKTLIEVLSFIYYYNKGDEIRAKDDLKRALEYSSKIQQVIEDEEDFAKNLAKHYR